MRVSADHLQAMCAHKHGSDRSVFFRKYKLARIVGLIIMLMFKLLFIKTFYKLISYEKALQGPSGYSSLVIVILRTPSILLKMYCSSD